MRFQWALCFEKGPRSLTTFHLESSRAGFWTILVFPKHMGIFTTIILMLVFLCLDRCSFDVVNMNRFCSHYCRGNQKGWWLQAPAPNTLHFTGLYQKIFKCYSNQWLLMCRQTSIPYIYAVCGSYLYSEAVGFFFHEWMGFPTDYLAFSENRGHVLIYCSTTIQLSEHFVQFQKINTTVGVLLLDVHLRYGRLKGTKLLRYLYSLSLTPDITSWHHSL